MKKKLSDKLRPLLLGALLLGAGAQAQVQPLDRIVAIVDNDVIMKSQLDQRVTEVEQNIARQGAEQPPHDQLERQVLDRLVLENLQLQMGQRAGIRIGDDELNDAMQTIAQRNGMSLEQFRSAVAKDGLSFEQAREQVRREMILSRVRQARVAERIQVTDQEVQNFLASDLGKLQLSEEYNLANIIVPLPDGATSEAIEAAERQANEIYQQLQNGADFARTAIARSAGDNALEGGALGWRKAAQLPPPFDAMIGSMNDGDITQPIRTPSGFIILKVLGKRGGQNQMVDEVHVRHILLKPSEIRSEAETERLAERLYQRIKNGENFADLARSFSEDPGSALNGGDLGWVSPDVLVPEFRRVMNETPVNELSKPFKSPFGWHVLEVLGRRASDNTQQAREQQARNLLRNRKYDEELQNWLRQIRDEAYVEIKL